MKAWLYYRLSRDEDEEMNSLYNQRQILVDYAEQQGYEIVGESSDDNVSGMTFDRKGLAELENAVDEGKVDVVLVKDLSRLGRHRTQTALFIDHLRENNVRVYSVTEGIDSFNDNDDLLIGMKQIINDFYAKDIGKKIKTGIRQKQKTGLIVNLPMGYYKDRNTNGILIDEVAADIVREIFQKYLEGYGISAIAKQLNARGIKSPEYFSHRRISSTRTKLCKKFLWVQTSVKRILENEIYTGTLVNHKTVTSKIYKTKSTVPVEEQFRHENYLPAIIDKQTFEQAQLLLENHKQGNIRASAFRKIHRYCSMIKCAQCGAILIAKQRKCGNNEWVEYTDLQHMSPIAQYKAPFNKLVETVNDGSEPAYIRTFITCPAEDYWDLGYGFNSGANAKDTKRPNVTGDYTMHYLDKWTDLGKTTVNGKEVYIFMCEHYEAIPAGDSILSLTKVWVYENVDNGGIDGGFDVQVFSEAIQSANLTYEEAMAALNNGKTDLEHAAELFNNQK